ncbi:hypothetical protein M0805_002488 [Coniferiporia weirii]|nr:hypothetical protein M0805_002488 [Coniferiporia weirii]
MMTDDNVSGSPQLSLGPNSPLSTRKGGNTLRHDEYYIPDGDVVLKVEKTPFRVHRYFLVRESPVFRDMLSLPPPSNKVLEGASDGNPIHLPQVKATEFAHFLWVFYNPKYSVYDAPLDTWIAILQLAHRWEFAEVRELVFRELGRMRIPPVTRLALAEKYDAAPGWHAEALAELGTRAEALTFAEGEQLGLRTVVKVAELRENIRRQKDNNRSRRRSPSYSRRRSWSPVPVIVQPPHHPPPPIIVPAPHTPPNMFVQHTPMVPEMMSLDSASQTNRVESKKRRLVRLLRTVFGRS